MPLAVIPYLESPTEVEQRLESQIQKRKLITWIAITCIVLAIVVTSFYLLPIEHADIKLFSLKP